MIVTLISQCAEVQQLSCPIQAVTAVTNHDQSYNRYAWMDT